MAALLCLRRAPSREAWLAAMIPWEHHRWKNFVAHRLQRNGTNSMSASSGHKFVTDILFHPCGSKWVSWYILPMLFSYWYRYNVPVLNHLALHWLFKYHHTELKFSRWCACPFRPICLRKYCNSSESRYKNDHFFSSKYGVPVMSS